MLTRKNVLILVFLLVSISLGLSIRNKYHDQPRVLGKDKTESDRIHPVLFFEKETFYQGVSKSETNNKSISQKITGGIVPHHLYPGLIIADFFHRLRFQNPKTLIIIGPNHYERGNYPILTSTYNWQTPFGKVEPELSIIDSLVSTHAVQIDEEVLPHDHAVAGILPFVKYYLPDTKIIPLLLSGRMNEAETRVLAKLLKSKMTQDIVVIAAVDFSHYLTSREAQVKDEVTLDVLKNRDYRQLFSLNNDYLDSPPSIAVLLMLMEEMGTTNMELLQHTNSGILQNNPYSETTSYFSVAFYK